VKYHLILTIDYELFGNGTGCLEHCVINPTRQCLDTLAAFSAPMTFFVDSSEFRAIKQVSQKQQGYAEFNDVEQQLKKALSDGHNLQLHLHPQWLDATYDPTVTQGTPWTLAYDKWRIGDLGKEDLERCIVEGMEYLTQLLPTNNGTENRQHLHVFRAGGWAIQPCSQVLKALTAHGITVETTVAPGAYNAAKGDWYDFRKTPKAPFWPIDDDICTASNTPISQADMLEAPIATASIGRIKHIKALLENRRQPSLPEGCTGSYDGPNNKQQALAGKASKVANIGRVMLDYSTLPSELLIEVTQQTMAQFAHEKHPVPIVAIGHNKNFTQHSNEHLATWLQWAHAHPDIHLSDYRQWTDTLSLHS